ncbi:MAG: hypothetical protein IJF98_03680 [Firmicutes bacterium]|nr:hypothetical protein [Bacillota bacterium]
MITFCKLVAITVSIVCLCGCNGAEKKDITINKYEPVEEELAETGKTTIRTDYNAVKEIKSKDISEFYVTFFTNNRWRGEEEHRFEFQVKPDENGALTASETNCGISAPADDELLNKLQEIIDKYGLVSMNGVYEENYSLAPEYHDCIMEVSYASGESFKFTAINNPYSQWTEEIYDVFAGWFAARGDESLYPEKETSAVTRFDMRMNEKGVWYDYGGVNVQDEMAINGEKYLLSRDIYDENAQKTITEDLIVFPVGYYEKIAEILDKYDVVRKYEFSSYDHNDLNYGNHDAGYFGWGDKTTADGEEDAQDRKLDIYVEFESGKRLNIETSKASEIDAMKPILDELTEYLDSLF